MNFGKIATSSPFGSVDGQSSPSTWQCWEIEGARGEYKQTVVKSDNPLRPDAIWMQIEGHHFKECECIRGEFGKEPDKCKTVPCSWLEYIPIVGDPGSGAQCPRTTITSETDSEGNKRYYFERITKCTPKQTCGPESTQPYGPVEAKPCKDYARCCFKGQTRVDQDTFTSPEPCYSDHAVDGGFLSPITRSGWCGNYVNNWLSTNPVNPRCDMDVDCSDPNAQPNENENIRCYFNFFEGHPND